MRPNQGLTYSRKIVTANKAWDCAALCGVKIKPKEDYVQDVVLQRVGFGETVAKSQSLRFHLRCAESDRTASKATAMKYFNEMEKVGVER